MRVALTVVLYVIPPSLFRSLPSDGQYLVLGGQHICAAVRHMRDRLMANRPGGGDDLPLCYRVVRGLVLRIDTPIRCSRQAAGWHQSTQQDCVDPSMTDVMRCMAKYVTQKRRKGLSDKLTEEEIFTVLMEMGLVRGNSSVLQKGGVNQPIDMTPDEASDLQEKTVCTPHQHAVSPSVP